MKQKAIRKALVTGGAGFIGSHVAEILLERGLKVDVLDDMSSGVPENVPAAVTLHRMDVRDATVKDLFASERYDLLVHHAAQMDVRRSVADPMFDADVNLRGLINLMEAGRTSGLQKVIFASTGGAIYGEPAYVPQDEDHPLRPLSPYGVTKLASEKYLYYYKHIHGIPFVALRYGNVYGPRQNPHGEAGVVAIFSRMLLDGAQPIINGDGEQTRDYVFVKDVAAANLAALDSKHTGVFNVGTGVETSVNRLFTRLRDELAPQITERHGPGKAGEQRRSVLSFERTRNLLGWEPTVNVKEGLRITADWFRERHRLNES